VNSRRDITGEQGREIRCTACNVLLAKLERGALNIQRGDLQASFDGEFHASLVCYRPRCRRLNVIRMSPSTKGTQGPAG
jgi:phage FluMu protein Com